MKILSALRSKYRKAAFLIGNGPNLYSQIMPSWTNLLRAAGDKNVAFALKGLSYTEVYDLVELTAKDHLAIKPRIVKQLALKKSSDLSTHRALMQLARETDSPVLTTNFDTAFEDSIHAQLHHTSTKGFTRFYPWKSYYATNKLNHPTSGFGIWKIHGDVRYKDSIRLGLTDYMGSVERARSISKVRYQHLRRNQNRRQVSDTWLDIWFELPIIIVGFGYGAHETFLRWLLIERKKYFRDFLEQDTLDMHYVSVGNAKPDVKNLLETLGVTFHSVDSFDDLYATL
ncbi:SIR2 family protein [Marinoscillum sp.]|uniref:SIR2 family protein n=1 Tax=Marinoscillum sp. TaxID=2024838 RepID=UPI003BA85A07